MTMGLWRDLDHDQYVRHWLVKGTRVYRYEAMLVMSPDYPYYSLGTRLSINYQQTQFGSQNIVGIQY